ncbi:putative toxin-antitoxin system toxin component, PIN family [Mucilaginibacter sp. 21P]|uniref:putative toxin-antitoxin system toxin component, PIN family n=1 Tax=Mucilaginibacter sp. 21P TaxID=2778902 RepID=UPI001C56ECD3|nr:putative toxin-antitoxin system toxin component, PIN family [Mucilaginibacter sp. 21P]QXV67050.1 putative toxin-antitoxin system toxin component, PIN family [Mucilaginibacter sp. 21P]
MPSRGLRVILDTNLWISFLIRKDHSFLTQLILSKKVRLLFSEELLKEFIEVSRRPKFIKYFSGNSVDEILDIINDFAEFIEVDSVVTACRDEKDNFLLSLAKDGRADYLITGDNDLLELNPFGKTKIILLSDFILEVNS